MERNLRRRAKIPTYSLNPAQITCSQTARYAPQRYQLPSISPRGLLRETMARLTARQQVQGCGVMPLDVSADDEYSSDFFKAMISEAR